MLKNLLLLVTIFISTSLSAQIWDGGGDNTSWDMATNWSPDEVPGEGATITFPNSITANVTGSAPNLIRRIIFDTLSNVTLDLDLNFDIAGNGHLLTLNKDANVTLGGTSDMRTFNLETGISRNALLLNSNGISLTITEQAILNIGACQNGFRISRESATIVNNGTINMIDYVEHGINLSEGTFTNNGTIEIGTGMVDGEPTSDGINIENGVFDNNAEGVITVTKPLDNGLQILGIFNNAGTISTISKDDAEDDNSGLVVGSTNSEGIMNNLAGGVINADGGLSEENRVFTIQNSGILNNAGEINVSNGNLGQALFNLGNLNNDLCGHINLIECRIANNNEAMLSNNGLINSSFTGSGINNGASAINNAFFGYTNTNSAFAGGNVEGVDNGQKTGEGIVVDAENSCTITDIGIDASYTWYTDIAGTVEAGTNDANGLLIFNNDVFPISGTQTLYTCFGEGVQLVVENVLGECAVLTGVDFIQLTDAFTMMPNPAQAFTQIKFGDEYIAKEKSIEVYNAVGQLVQAANLDNVDNYILHTSDLASGVYTVNLQTEKGMQIERLVIQK